jgi:hypothetical protein
MFQSNLFSTQQSQYIDTNGKHFHVLNNFGTISYRPLVDDGWSLITLNAPWPGRMFTSNIPIFQQLFYVVGGQTALDGKSAVNDIVNKNIQTKKQYFSVPTLEC